MTARGSPAFPSAPLSPATAAEPLRQLGTQADGFRDVARHLSALRFPPEVGDAAQPEFQAGNFSISPDRQMTATAHRGS